MRFENIHYLEKGVIKNTNGLKQISDLSGGEISLIEGALIMSSKYIIITEGTYDIRYIRKAIDFFSIREPKYGKLKKVGFIPMGSAGNTKSFFDDVIKNLLDNVNSILYIFDYDKAGVSGSKEVESLKQIYSKINWIFYQHNYDSNYPIEENKKCSESPFYIEDIFDSQCYQNIVSELHSKKQYREYKVIKQSTCDKIKEHIERGYISFDEAYYNGFIPLLERIYNIMYTDLH